MGWKAARIPDAMSAFHSPPFLFAGSCDCNQIFWQRQRARQNNGLLGSKVIEAVEFRGQRCPGGWRLASRLGVPSFKEPRLNRALASSVFPFPASNRSDGAGLTGSTGSRVQTTNSTRRRRDKMRRTPSTRWLEAGEKRDSGIYALAGPDGLVGVGEDFVDIVSVWSVL